MVHQTVHRPGTNIWRKQNSGRNCLHPVKCQQFVCVVRVFSEYCFKIFSEYRSSLRQAFSSKSGHVSGNYSCPTRQPDRKRGPRVCPLCSWKFKQETKRRAPQGVGGGPSGRLGARIFLARVLPAGSRSSIEPTPFFLEHLHLRIHHRITSGSYI